MQPIKRKIPKALKAYLDYRLFSELDQLGGLDTPTNLFVMAARSLVGTVEVGKNAGQLVQLIQATVGDAVNEPWCLSFIQACIAYTELTCGVESDLVATEHVLTLWNASRQANKVDRPSVGDLILWRYGKTISGHCGIVIDVNAHGYLTIEGNTSPAIGDIEREGDGVFIKTRLKGGMGKFEEIGFLRVFPNST